MSPSEETRKIGQADEIRRFLTCPGCGLKRLFSEYEGRCDECLKAAVDAH
jgi:hypothetical protein